ncbi:uncharacterized protein UTRI_03442_B [Ustilago trichophora]|uniref:PH domain-containing protein n=1 Tax=Ustilago trichophora TaxID=86804 RepID=A0A5C3E328_9BASI|nr:uncharacterized protein UTRI_03442_B [Ustilago trichophora]
MVVSSPPRPILAHAFEPPLPPPRAEAKSTASQFGSNTTTSSSAVQIPPPKPRCLKCQPILQHSCSTASVPTNLPHDSTSFDTLATHVSIRQYIGPLPVPSSAAKAIAKAIAEDGAYTPPQQSARELPTSDQPPSSLPNHHDVNAADYASSPTTPPSTSQAASSHTWTDPFQVSSPSEHHTNQANRVHSPPSSPSTLSKAVPLPPSLPPARPRVFARDPSSASVLSNASYVSAQSITRSALSDTETTQRAQTIFDLRPSTATDASSSTSRSVSPSKRRFALRNRKSNQSFPVNTATPSSSAQPPTSILKPPAPSLAFNRANTDLAALPSRHRKVSNVRSADNLRIAALRQQRRIGSEGSGSPASAASSPHAPSLALPLLDLPLDEIEEAINDPVPSRHVQSSSEPTRQPPQGSVSETQASQHDLLTPNYHISVPEHARRTLNSSNETTIIRKSDDETRKGAPRPFLKPKSSFSSGSESHAVESQQPPAPAAKLERQDLLHPAWEQSANTAPGADATSETLLNGSTTLRDPPSDTDLDDHQQSPTKASRNIVGRGLPTKRSLTFSREPSLAQAPRHVTNPTGIHLPRAVDHPREISRQSRMSRASTAGTFNTVGTIATEGSFGATAGKASTLARRFLAGGSFRRVPKRTDSMQNRSQRNKLSMTRTDSVHDPFASSSPSSARTRKTSPFAVRHRRTLRSVSHASMQRDPTRRISASGTEASIADSTTSGRVQGVQPGAVGTSTGGTKWVGESFQVGKRFWDILNARRDELNKSQPCSCGTADQSANRATLDGADAVAAESSAAEQKQVEEQTAKVEHLKQSPDGVITLLAQEAQDISDDKASEAQAQAQVQAHAERTSAKKQASRELDTPLPATTRPQTDSAGCGRPSRRKLTNDVSQASIQTVHPEEAAPVAIEARQGWSEIVSKMSSLTGELGTGLKARTIDRKGGQSSQRESLRKETDGKSAARSGRDIAKSTPEQNGSPKLPADSDFKILARSSSLVESDKSSAASKSIYASLAPSTHLNGFAPRASSLAPVTSPSMTRSDALSHPAPPASVEANNPELVHQLLRRKSDLGERPDHLPDTASDHAVVIKPVASPLNLTPTRELASPYAEPLLEQDPLPLDTTPSSENNDQPSHASPLMPTGLLKAVGLSSSPERKKTVKFDTGSTRPALKGRFTASLFAGRADDDQPPLSNLVGAAPGDTQPRPPEEVLARPQPNVIQQPRSGDGSTPSSEVYESEASLITRRSVLKKDRMLVKIAWTPHEDLPSDFDELQARKYPIREEEWREYVVVFRMGKLELWTDPSFTNKLTGHGDRLKLRTTIPLSRGSTLVSLYSPIDRIFALTYQPWKSMSSHHKRGIHLRRQGTDIALFDCRARSAAADWIWELWRELGGLIPESLEVHVPSFGLKVKIPIPESMPLERATPSAPASGIQLSGEKDGLFALSSIGQSMDVGEGFKLINRNNIIAMTWKLFDSVEQWRELMAIAQKRGLRLELAWRRGTELDWVINERTVEDEPRHWAVLCGALLRDYKHPSILELRAAAHYPTSVLIRPGQYLQEPPAVEGFLWRVKPVSGALTRLYFTTYDGHLYVCRTTRAFPPDRHLAVQMQEAMDMRVPRTSGATQGRAAKPATPATKSALARALAKFVGANKAARRDEDVATLRQNVLEAISYPAETEEEFKGQIEAYQSFERRRQFEQIRGSDGFIDLKLIHTIKTIGNGPVRCPGEDDIRHPTRGGTTPLMQKVKGDLAVAQRDGEESDDEDDSYAANDIGGQEGLELADDANELRRARQIEITLTNGKSIRLEAFSAPVAREWVERVSELVKYWRRRERADATELMYAAGMDVSEIHKQLQGRKTHTSGIDGVDEQKLSPMLGNIWNWCQIEGCRNIIRSGRLFHKKSSYSAFKARDYVLIAGRLLCFKLVKSVRTTRARQNNGIFHRRQDTVIHLRDAYVYSGKLSEDMLKNGRSDPAQAVTGIGGGGSNSGKRHRVPRVYADGLFSVDDDEDCTFVIRYRPERVNTPADPNVASLSPTMENGKAKGETTVETAYSVPKLEDKTHKYIAMRARSKTERDVWVRCITYEIEKIVRDDVEREKKLKNTGKVDYK